MDGTTIALIAGPAVLAFLAGGAAGLAAASRNKRPKREAVKLAVEKTQALNTKKSDEQIDKIYDDVLAMADAAHRRATSSVRNDVSSSYIALTAKIMTDLGGIYNLGEGIFQMVLAVRESLHKELEISIPIYSLPVDGESISMFPNNPNRGGKKSRHDSVNEEMKRFITAFYDFWRDETARKNDMKRARVSLGLALNADDELKKAVLHLMDLEE
jgi:hypothetical protein